MTDANQISRPKIYQPPEADEIEAAAALLSKKLERDRDFEDGFGSLLKAIAKAYANHLSRQQSSGGLDNDHETP